jgi:hypothetical protein
MRAIGVFAVVATACFAVACSKGLPEAASAPSAAESPAGGAEPTGSESQAMPGTPPPAAAPTAGAAGRAEREEAPSDDERPGLGTEFGESRESRISTTHFTRQDPSRPFDTLKLFYNDAAGARAMARRAGLADLGSALASTRQNAITVRLLDSSGSPLEGFSSGANTYVVGASGDRYTIQIENHTGARFEAVTTVDGLDVINGRTGALSNRGYIVGAFATVEIDGWRRSTDTVAAFRFGRVSQSYAGKTGSDRNVGVIGVAVFEEDGSNLGWTNSEIDKRHSANPFPGSSTPSSGGPLSF